MTKVKRNSLNICYRSSVSSKYLKSTLFLVPVSDLTDKMKSDIHSNSYFVLVDFCVSCDNYSSVYKKVSFNLVKKLYDTFGYYYLMPKTNKIRIYVNSFFATNIEEEIKERVLVNIEDEKIGEELLKKIVKWVREEMA